LIGFHYVLLKLHFFGSALRGQLAEFLLDELVELVAHGQEVLEVPL
jgi:hypothetical protein